jgi:hypothetical protein
MSSKRSSKITWSFEQSSPEELREPFKRHHYMGDHSYKFTAPHCYAAVYKDEQIAFVGAQSNSRAGQRQLWLIVLPEWDGYGIGLVLARLAASRLLTTGFNRVSFITEKKSLVPLLTAGGWLQDRPPCHPSPNAGESEARRRARLSVWQYRFYLTTAPTPDVEIGMQVTGWYGSIYGDSCVKDGVIETVTEKMKRGRPRKHDNDQARWRLAQQAKRRRDRDTLLVGPVTAPKSPDS